MGSHINKIIKLIRQYIKPFRPKWKRGETRPLRSYFLIISIIIGLIITVGCGTKYRQADALGLFQVDTSSKITQLSLENYRKNPIDHRVTLEHLDHESQNLVQLTNINNLTQGTKDEPSKIEADTLTKNSLKAVLLEDGVDKYGINQFIAKAIDPTAKFNDNAAPSRPLINLDFTFSSASIFRLGFPENVYWMRATITNKSRQKQWFLEIFPSSLDYVDVYLPTEHGWDLKRYGRMYPFKNREIKDYRFVIPINIETQTTQTIYLRIATETSLIFEANLWQPSAFWQNRHQSQLLQGIVYGIFGFAILYNLFLLISLRDFSYYYFVMFVMALSLGYLAWDGLGFQYIWSENVFWNRVSVPISLNILSASILGFTNHFLNIRHNNKRWHLILKTIFFGAISGIPLSLLASYRISILFSNITLFVVAITCFMVGIVARSKSKRSATIFLLTWGILLLSFGIGIITNLFALTPIPISFMELIRYNGVFIVIALSLAIADRINHLRDQIVMQQKDSLRLKDELNYLLTQRQDELEKLVTERTQALKEAKEVAEAANHAKSSFLSNMSHELRTPMNSVLGFVQLLQMEPNLKPERQKILATIASSGHHLLSLINDVLDMSRIESGQIDLNLNQFYLAGLIEEVEEILLVKARDKQLKFITSLEPGLPQVIYGDQLKLRQVLINLLNNAIKFTDIGEVSLTVTRTIAHSFTSHLDDSITSNASIHEHPSNLTDDLENTFAANTANVYLRFTVKDTGIGMNQTDLEQVFTPFFQIKNNTNHKDGTGLGLAISSRLVKVMGGTINVSSIPQNGTTFTVDLPFGIVELEDKNYDDLSKEASQFTESTYTSSDQVTSRFKVDQFGLISLNNANIDTKFTESDYTQIDRLTSYNLSDIAPEVSFQNKNQDKFKLNYPTINTGTRSSHWQDIKILIAEDNPVNRSLILIMLQELGYTSINAVTNGSEVMNAVAKEKYDLILMDINMPQMDGLEATRQIIANYGNVRPVIIAVTANALEEDRARCFAVGVDDYLSKPLRINTLKQVLRDRFNIN